MQISSHVVSVIEGLVGFVPFFKAEDDFGAQDACARSSKSSSPRSQDSFIENSARSFSSAKNDLKTVQALVKWHTEKSKEMSQHIITLEKKRRCAGNTEAITNDLSRQLDEARSAYERERESTLEARQILDDLQTRRDEMRMKYAAVFKTEQTRPSEESDQLRLVKWRRSFAEPRRNSESPERLRRSSSPEGRRMRTRSNE